MLSGAAAGRLTRGAGRWRLRRGESRARAGFHVLTIFVNPTQFAPTEDLAKYPRPIEKDLQMCRQAGVHVVYMPEISALYPDGYDTWVAVDAMSKVLEGEFRPTHFRGVTTIVLKLLNIVQPDVACFGEGARLGVHLDRAVGP